MARLADILREQKKTKRTFDLEDLPEVMENIDPVAVLEELGIDESDITVSRNELCTYCPDHEAFTGRMPSDKKWYWNLENGKTFCHTEGRGSTIVGVANRIWGLDSYNETVKRLLSLSGTDTAQLEENKRKREEAAERQRKHEQRLLKAFSESLSRIEQLSREGYLSDRAIRYFLKPPCKQWTGIEVETLKRFGVYTKQDGIDADAVAIVPARIRGKVLGYVTLDILGKQKWLDRWQDAAEEDYKKVKYPFGFKKSLTLFGYDEVGKGCDILIITEGVRDAMKLTQEGFKAVSILGSHLSDEQERLIKELEPKACIVLLDGDKAGRDVAAKVAGRLARHFPTRIGDAGDGLDPKNLDKLAIEAVIEKAKRVV